MEGNKKYFTLYPIHINSLFSLNKGRKYSKELSVDNPSMREIRISLKTFKFTEEGMKRHPKDYDTLGRFQIYSEGKKTDIIKQVIKNILSVRNSRKTEQAGTKNVLNLVPRKKNKKKKR